MGYIPSAQQILTTGLAMTGCMTLKKGDTVSSGKVLDFAVEKCLDSDGNQRCTKSSLSASQHATTLSGALRAPSATPLLRSRMLQVERWFTIVIPTGIGLPRRASWSTSTSSQRSGRLATIPSSTRSLPASKVQNNRQNGLGKGNGKRG